MHTSDFVIDKLQLSSLRLDDTIRGFFFGAHPATSIDNARAVSNILRNIVDYYIKVGALPEKRIGGELRWTLGKRQSDLQQQNRAHFRQMSNFAKHADTDTLKTMGYAHGFAAMGLKRTCDEFEEVTAALNKRGLALINGDDLRVIFNAEGAPILCNTTTEALIRVYEEWYGPHVSQMAKMLRDFKTAAETDGHHNMAKKFPLAFKADADEMARMLRVIQDLDLMNSPPQGGYILVERRSP